MPGRMPTTSTAPNTFVLGTRTGIANASGAAGLLFLPNNHLAVGGQNNNHVSEVTTGGAIGPVVAAGTGFLSLGAQRRQHIALQFLERPWQRRDYSDLGPAHNGWWRVVGGRDTLHCRL
jgi:hypothetical protein